jgi:hypothetical protein
MTLANDLAVRRALDAAGVEFIDENGGGPGMRLKKRARPNCIEKHREARNIARQMR